MHPHSPLLEITALQWAESFGAGIVAAIAVVVAVLYGIKRLLTAIRELRHELEAVKKKASSASSAATSAAASAQKIDQSLHTNNSGSHVRDDMDKWTKSHVALDRKMDSVLEKVEKVAASQATLADDARTDRSAADMIHRELFRQVEELRGSN